MRFLRAKRCLRKLLFRGAAILGMVAGMNLSNIALALPLVIASFATSASAQTVEQDGKNDEYSMKTQAAEQVFVQYHQAIEAKQRCMPTQFSADDLAAFDKATASEMVAVSPDISYGAGRLLNLRRQTESATDRLVDREGCKGQKVKKELAFFDDRLATLRPMPTPAPAPDAAASTPAAMPEAAAPAAMPATDRAVASELAPESLTPADMP